MHEETWMHGARFRRARYRRLTEDWDHDHCEVCWAEFMDIEDDDVLREGYLFRPTPLPPVLPPEEERTTFHEDHRVVSAPTDDRWVCPSCFRRFAERYGWVVEEG